MQYPLTIDFFGKLIFFTKKPYPSGKKLWVNSVATLGVHFGDAIGVTFKVLCDHIGSFLVSLKSIFSYLEETGVFCSHFSDIFRFFWDTLTLPWGHR